MYNFATGKKQISEAMYFGNCLKRLDVAETIRMYGYLGKLAEEKPKKRYFLVRKSERKKI